MKILMSRLIWIFSVCKCMNLPGVRSYPTLPYYIQLFRNQILETAIAFKMKSPPRGIKEVLGRV